MTIEEEFKERCIQNKYWNTYWRIIDNARNRNWKRKKDAPIYVEGHHFVPDAIIPNNKRVFLTAKEHLICHHLIVRFTVGADREIMLWGLMQMMNYKKYNKKHITSRMFSKIREEGSKLVSEKMIGRKMKPESIIKMKETKKLNPQEPYKRTPEMRQTAAENSRRLQKEGLIGMKGKKQSDKFLAMVTNRTGEDHPSFGYKHTDDALNKITNALTGRPVSQETRQKLRSINTGRIIPPEELERGRAGSAAYHERRRREKAEALFIINED